MSIHHSPINLNELPRLAALNPEPDGGMSCELLAIARDVMWWIAQGHPLPPEEARALVDEIDLRYAGGCSPGWAGVDMGNAPDGFASTDPHELAEHVRRRALDSTNGGA